MNGGVASARPAWQTDELEDEWIDQEGSDDSHATLSIHAHSSSDVSLTQPLGSVIVRNSELRADSPPAGEDAGGTFLIREDVPPAPLLPKTPGKGKNPFGKDFFSPLALERMFEPPSPPVSNPPLPPVQPSVPSVPSRLSQVYVPHQEGTEIMGDVSERDISDQSGGDGLGMQDGESGILDCQFTFEAPRPSPFNPNRSFFHVQHVSCVTFTATSRALGPLDTAAVVLALTQPATGCPDYPHCTLTTKHRYEAMRIRMTFQFSATLRNRSV